MMEMTFYDDVRSSAKGDGKFLKRPATLDLDSPNTASKKQRFTAILTSPDLNMLKLASPELERLIMANGSLTTATPTPTQILFPKSVTEEQENYARGFIDALNHLHQTTSFDVNTTIFARSPSDNNNPTSGASKMFGGLVPIYLTSPTATSVIKSSGNVHNVLIGNASNIVSKSHSVLTNLNLTTVRPPSVESTNSSSCNSSSLPAPLEIAIKEEYQTVPSDFSSPPMSPITYDPTSRIPINMADQEKIKIERKRYRNRIAASKCRQRKLEKISQLEEKVNELKGENAELEMCADKLREQVCSLKQTVLEHVKKGCQIMVHQHL